MALLEEVQVHGGACFGPDPLTISGLQTVNYIFGPNGSGKTTISRAFQGRETLAITPTWGAGGEHSIRVYNRDFVDRVLRDSQRLPGVFVLGEHSVEAEKQLEKIQAPGGELERAENALKNIGVRAQKALEAKDEKYTSLAKIAFSRLKTFMQQNPVLQPAFSGRGGISGDSKKMFDHVLKIDLSDDTAIPKLEDLCNEATAVFDSSVSTLEKLGLITLFGADNHEGYALLQSEIKGSSDTTLSALVEQLGNSDWVSDGRKYRPRSGGLCPFCQQPEPATLATQLASLFDDHYTQLKQQLQSFHDKFHNWACEFEKAIDSFDQASLEFVKTETYFQTVDKIKLAIQGNQRALADKLRTPSESVEFTDLDPLVKDLNDLLEDANSQITKHNQLVDSRKEQHPNVVEKSRKYLAKHIVSEEISEYKSKLPGLNKGIQVTGGQQADAQQKVDELNTTIRDLQQSVNSTKPAIERINKLLTRTGFTSFTIKESDRLDNGYMLVRDGNRVEEHSLSEGERTFIAFLYYMQQLESREENGSANRILAVIDDPISSLDSDVLFIVGALIRSLINRALNRADHIGQLIILTHNVYFHKDITHLNHGEKKTGRSYFVIQKQLDGPHTIEPHKKNPVSTEYERLWSEVRRAKEGKEVSIIGLENTLRRILESYFKLLGRGIWQDDFAKAFSPEERPILDSLFAFANQGSHAVFEDLYYSPTVHAEKMYLEVFRKIFQAHDQEGHYNMMMATKENPTS